MAARVARPARARRWTWRTARALAVALVLLPLTAAIVLAHPLGNFTINHYTGIRVESDRVRLDVVIDRAEIPTFQVTATLDTDRDGRLSSAETAEVPVTGCLEVGRDLRLAVDGSATALTLVAAGATFPPGNGGLATMRLVCGFEAPAAIAEGTRISLRDDFAAARIGWREMTAVGSGVSIVTPRVPDTTSSARLTAYPASLGSAPDVRELSFDVRPGGPILPDIPAPDAAQVEPVTVDGSGSGPAVGETVTGSYPGSVPSPAPMVDAADPETAVVPGGAEALPDVLRRAPVDPLLALGAFLVAAALGAGHALTPGHGKTLMAAYLVGTRGTRAHAVGLGLTVSVTHTIGILVLALVVLAAETALPADLVVRLAPVVAAASIVVVGAWMLLGEVRRRSGAHGHSHDHGHAQDHDHGHAHDHGHSHDHGHEQDHDRGHAHEPDHGHDHDARPMRWRGLAVLGLAGGLIPSANALLILLGTIAAGRAIWGVVLVGAFGLGMAAVMTGIGLAAVSARSLLDRASTPAPFAAARRLVPLATSVLVLVLGVVLSAEALGAARLG